jgi:hypothetical protein
VRSPGRFARLRLSAAVVGLALLAAACGGSGPAPSSSTTIPGPFASQPSAAGTASPTAAASPGGSTAGATVPIDPTLLEILPATVSGLPVAAVPDPSGTDDPGLVESVERMAQALVVDPASDAFVFASVIVPRSGVFDDEFFRSWRDSFDEGACSQAGGVTGHAQATIGGRTAYIGSCEGGVLTYHVWLEDRDAIVSASALGDSRLGEQLVAGLRP